MKMTMEQVFDAIAHERQRQDLKWGADKQQSLPGYLLVVESELNEAKEGWVKNLINKHAPLSEVLQIAAVCVACMERYGVEGSAIATDDIPET